MVAKPGSPGGALVEHGRPSVVRRRSAIGYNEAVTDRERAPRADLRHHRPVRRPPRDPGLRPGVPGFGGAPAFSGPIATLKVFEDNTLIKQAVESPGEGRVLVVDGGGIEALRAGRRQPRRLGRDQRLGRDRRLRLHPGRRRAGRAAARRPRARRRSRARASAGCTPGRPASRWSSRGSSSARGRGWPPTPTASSCCPQEPAACGPSGAAAGRGGACGRRSSSAAVGGRLRRLGEAGVPLVQPGADVVRRVGAALPLVAGQHDPGRRHAGEAGQSEELPEAHGP